MARSAIRTEEAVGLVAAVAVHAGLVLVLMARPAPPPLVPPVEKMTVTLADEVGLTSTSPEPAAQAAPDMAPTIGEPPAPEPAPKVEPPRPEPVRPASPKPAVKASPAPRPAASPDPIGSLARRTPQAQPAKTGQKASPAPRPSAQAGGSRIGDDFLRGVPGSRASGPAQAAPAAAIGPAVRSALAGAISRQLKPRWSAPQGVDADKLVTVLSWSLNRDGTLAGSPRVIRQEGINEANRAQAQRHAEQAVRAVQLAAPFNLPEEYYDAWKRVAEFRFDKRLAQ